MKVESVAWAICSRLLKAKALFEVLSNQDSEFVVWGRISKRYDLCKLVSSCLALNTWSDQLTQFEHFLEFLGTNLGFLERAPYLQSKTETFQVLWRLT